MLRRVVFAGVLVASAGIYAFAANERATFVLTDGERKSGAIVAHGDQRENLINGYLNISNDNGGPELTFPVSQVAVIDFTGGGAQPQASELSQMPSSGNFLVLRSGQGQGGTFVNMTNGDTLVWRNEAGQTQQYSLNDVARIYLNPQAARTAFNYSGAPAAVGTAGEVAGTPGSVVVQANQAWTDAGLTVKKGDRVSFSATGQISFAQGQTAGPDGNGAMHQQTYPVPVMPVGGLIGRVGTGTPFPIGSNTQPIAMPNDGRLMLGINDNELGDNSGAFTVTVRKQ